MPDDYEFSRVLLLAVDAWRYGTRDGRAQFELQQHLKEAMSVAAARSRLDWSGVQIQGQGDGLLAILPDGGAEPTLVDPFVRELDTWLSRHNHDRVPQARLRLRVAVHNGPVVVAQSGYAAAGPVDVCRLRDSAPVRGALNAAPDANLVLVVSERVFEDVICQRHTSLSASDFTRVVIADEAKDFHRTAWLRVPGVPGVPADDPPADDTLAVRFLASTGDRPGQSEEEPDTGVGSVIAYGDKSAAIGHGVFGDLHFGDVYGRDGRP